MIGRRLVLAAAILLAEIAVVRAEDAPKRHMALETRSQWRCFFVWQRELIQWSSGEVLPFAAPAKGPIQKEPEGAAPLSAAPAADWASPDFDDTAWAFSPGPFEGIPSRRDLAAIYLRARFEVSDPAAAGELSLTMSFRGGAAVYLNGKELVRKHLPGGRLEPNTLAEPYPPEAYVDPDGALLAQGYGQQRRQPIVPAGMQLRQRKIDTLQIPPAELRKGMNVLAIELHRAPTSELFYTAKNPTERGRPEWSMVGFDGLELTAASTDGFPAPATVSVWPGNPLIEMWNGGPREVRGGLAPVSIVGTRNGAFSGVVVLHSTQPIRGLKVEPSDLAHAEARASVPAAAVEVRYGLAGDAPVPGLQGRYPKGAQFLGVLGESAPQEVTVPAGASGATLPIWLTIRVGRDAAPGDYRGALAIHANNIAVSAPVHLSVADYALPDTKEFVAFAGLMQSPESVALKYGVELWSDAHWKLLDKTFRWLGQVRVRAVYIPIVAQTNHGNAQSMVRWVRQADGSYTHDFSIVEKYLDLVVKHLGQIPVVCFEVWTPAHGGGSFGSTPSVEKNYRPMMFTALDPATGATKEVEGPDWGTAGSVPFWKPVFEGLRKRLADRGLEKSMALGIVCDFTPSQQALNDLKEVAPNVPWVVHAHGLARNFAGMPVAEAAHVWGTRGPNLSTDPGKRYGWQNRTIVSVFARWGAGSLGHMQASCPVGVFHAALECYQASGYDGLGRQGADFWPVIQGARGEMSSVISRYSYRDRPGAPTMTNGSYLFPAPEGPVATVRFEALRLGMQETEARIFIEKALVDKALRAKLGDELAQRAQEFLDDRVRAIMRAKDGRPGSPVGSDASWLWYAGQFPESARTLFRLAAEVAAKLKP